MIYCIAVITLFTVTTSMGMNQVKKMDCSTINRKRPLENAQEESKETIVTRKLAAAIRMLEKIIPQLHLSNSQVLEEGSIDLIVNAADAIRCVWKASKLCDNKTDLLRSPLSVACCFFKDEIQNIITILKQKLSVEDTFGRTPFHYAAAKSKPELMRLLIDLGLAHVEIEDAAGGTAFHYAVYTSNTNVLLFLQSQEGNCNRRNNNGETPLHHAAKHNTAKAVRLLIEIGADLDGRDNLRRTPLHAAVRAGSDAAVQELLAQGAFVDAQDHVGHTPLYYAIHSEPSSAVTMITEHLLKNETNLQTDDEDIVSFLHQIAAALKEIQACCMGCFLVKAGGGWNYRYFEYLRRYSNSIKFIKKFVEQIQCDEVSGGANFLVLALTRYYKKEATRLLRDLDTYLLDSCESLAMLVDYIVANNCFDVIDLLKELTDLSVHSKDSHGNTLLHYAARNNHVPTILRLKQQGGSIRARNNFCCEPLHLATCDATDAMACLLKEGADIEAACMDGRRPLHYAAHEGDIEAIRMLIRNGANIEAKDNKGNTPLHSASKVLAVEELLKAGALVNAANLKGKTPLHMAIKRDESAVVISLFVAGAEVEAKDAQGNILLNYYLNYFNRARACLLQLIDMKRLTIAQTRANEPGKLTNEEEHFLVVDPNARFEDTATPLIRATKTGILPLVKFLLRDKRTDVNARGPKGKTALHIATRCEDIDILFALLSLQRTDTMVTNDKKQTAYQYYIMKYRQEEAADIGKTFALRKMWVQSYLSLKNAKCSLGCGNCLHLPQLPAEICLKIVRLLNEKSLPAPAKSKNVLHAINSSQKKV